MTRDWRIRVWGIIPFIRRSSWEEGTGAASEFRLEEEVRSTEDSSVGFEVHNKYM